MIIITVLSHTLTWYLLGVDMSWSYDEDDDEGEMILYSGERTQKREKYFLMYAPLSYAFLLSTDWLEFEDLHTLPHPFSPRWFGASMMMMMLLLSLKISLSHTFQQQQHQDDLKNSISPHIFIITSSFHRFLLLQVSWHFQGTGIQFSARSSLKDWGDGVDQAKGSRKKEHVWVQVGIFWTIEIIKKKKSILMLFSELAEFSKEANWMKGSLYQNPGEYNKMLHSVQFFFSHPEWIGLSSRPFIFVSHNDQLTNNSMTHRHRDSMPLFFVSQH